MNVVKRRLEYRTQMPPSASRRSSRLTLIGTDLFTAETLRRKSF